MKSENWKNKISGCFGMNDGKFGLHPLDRERSKEMLKEAIDAEVTMQEMIEACTEYMKNDGAGDPRIKEEIQKIRNLDY
jgi:hypothetical protein